MVDSSVVGRELGSVTFPIEHGKVREFTTAVLGSPDGAPTPLEMPPTFTMTSSFWGERASVSELGFDQRRILHAEQDYEYLAPVVAGDRLTGSTVVKDLYTKSGKKGGALTFIVLETTYRNQRDEHVLTERTIAVETSKPASASAAGS